MDDQYFLLEITISSTAEEGSYQLEISHTDPTSQAQVASQRGIARFDRTELLAREQVPEEYGRTLALQLFADKEIEQRFVRVEEAALVQSRFLRLSLRIDPSAQDLQSLRWELLRHPRTDAVLATSEALLFSRFMISADFRPVQLRGRAKLSALIAISAPPAATLTRMGLATVDFDGELARVKAALTGIEVHTLGGPGSPFTLDRMIAALREGVDILYLVSHGMLGSHHGIAALILQDEAGEAKPVECADLAQRITELQSRPRLVVLASCQSAGDGSHLEQTVGTLASLLADVGVPAVLGMRGYITMATVEAMMPVFFAELLRDGQIDRALAVARGRVRGHLDSWMPALYIRLKSGRLWSDQSNDGKIWIGAPPDVLDRRRELALTTIVEHLDVATRTRLVGVHRQWAAAGHEPRTVAEAILATQPPSELAKIFKSTLRGLRAEHDAGTDRKPLAQSVMKVFEWAMPYASGWRHRSTPVDESGCRAMKAWFALTIEPTVAWDAERPMNVHFDPDPLPRGYLKIAERSKRPEGGILVSDQADLVLEDFAEQLNMVATNWFTKEKIDMNFARHSLGDKLMALNAEMEARSPDTYFTVIEDIEKIGGRRLLVFLREQIPAMQVIVSALEPTDKLDRKEEFALRAELDQLYKIHATICPPPRPGQP